LSYRRKCMVGVLTASVAVGRVGCSEQPRYSGRH
jgi:hypothetical protein